MPWPGYGVRDRQGESERAHWDADKGEDARTNVAVQRRRVSNEYRAL